MTCCYEKRPTDNYCQRCGVYWDFDEDPPCFTNDEITEQKRREAVREMKEVLDED